MTDEELTPEEKNARVWTELALCIGFNELAKLGKTLGDKVFARLARDTAVENLIALGGNGGKSPFADDGTPICTIEMGAPMPWVKFHERDIELMRRAVAEYDIRAASQLPGGDT